MFMESKGHGGVAVFVDGDNINPAYAGRIRDLGESLGRLNVARVYADAVHATGWNSADGYRLIHAGSGKNAADLLLSIEVMELVQTRDFSAIVLASSDGDFTHLALRLRERGLRVVGIGEGKAPERFRAACSEFRIVSEGHVVPQAAPHEATVSELDRKIRATILAHSKKGAGMRISDLAPKMNTQYGVRIGARPERTWRAYFSKRADLYDLDPRGPEAHVRIKAKGFAL